MIYIDFETRSEGDLKKLGAWKYSLLPSTEVMCMALLDDFYDEPETILLIPSDFKHFFQQKKPESIESHGAFFEFAQWHNIMVPRYGWPRIPADQWYCSAAKAAYHGLPRKLEDAAIALDLTVKKDAEGSRLMKQMSKPRPKWKKTGEGPKWFEDEKKLERLYCYCKRDVEVEYALSQTLDDLPKMERKIWLLDQTINRRGVYCDVELAQSAIEIIHTLETDAKAELRELTDGEVSTPGQTERIRKYLDEKEDLQLPNMQAETIEEVLKRKDLTKTSRQVLEIRQLNSKASTKKYQAMLDRADNDQRMRELLRYHGAHTGRWAGRAIQPQNFYKPNIERSEIEYLAIPEIKDKNSKSLNFLFGNSIRVLSSALRSTLRAAPEKDLIGADYTSIEARVLLWLVGDTRALAKIKKGVDLYIDMAATIYGIPIDQVTKQQRDLGKVAILGLGYGMGVDKFWETCNRFGIEIDYTLAEKTVYVYREKYCKVVLYWQKINNQAIEKSEPFSLHGRFLQFRLPSGRSLHYCDPELTLNRFHGPALTYMAQNSITRKWERQETYGGKLTENEVQAIARDIMALGMLRAEDAGYPIILTIHDEIVSEIYKDFGSIKEFVQLLCKRPSWAKNCPIDAEGWRGERYRK
jgi:DNA polymerase